MERTEKICAGYRVRKLKSGPDPGLPNAEWVTQYFQLISGNMPIGSQAIDQTAISKTHHYNSALIENGTVSVE